MIEGVAFASSTAAHDETGGSSDERPAAARAPRRGRVLRIITRLNVGGPARHVLLADRGLAARGWDTLLVHGTVEPSEAEVDLAGWDLPMRRIPQLARPIRPVADLRATLAIARLIRTYRPHVIHTHLSKAGLVGRTAALVTTKAPRVHTYHGNVFGGYFSPRMSDAILRTERFLGRSTDRIVALSAAQREELLHLRIGSPDRIRIVPLGLDLERFAGQDRAAARTALGLPADALVLLAVGRLVPIKRLDRLIAAFVRLAPERPALRLVLVGDGDERSALEQLVARHEVGRLVTFAGWSAETPSWYAASDVVALTSDREGTPLALIEAAASGRPVVAVDVGGVRDIVRDGETGYVVPVDDAPAFADRLAALLGDPVLRERMGRAAPVAATAFAADRLVDDLDRLYRETLATRRAPATVRAA